MISNTAAVLLILSFLQLLYLMVSICPFSFISTPITFFLFFHVIMYSFAIFIYHSVDFTIKPQAGTVCSPLMCCHEAITHDWKWKYGQLYPWKTNTNTLETNRHMKKINDTWKNKTNAQYSLPSPDKVHTIWLLFIFSQEVLRPTLLVYVSSANISAQYKIVLPQRPTLK